MKVQGNRYINNPEMIKNKVEKKTTVPQNIHLWKMLFIIRKT